MVHMGPLDAGQQKRLDYSIFAKLTTNWREMPRKSYLFPT